MKQYIEALKYCFENGSDVESRAGKVRKNFGFQMRFNLQNGFPAMTTKKLAWKSVVSELLWFLEGSDDERRQKFYFFLISQFSNIHFCVWSTSKSISSMNERNICSNFL